MGVSLDLIIWQPQAQGIAVFELDAVSVISSRLAVLIFIFVKACAVVKRSNTRTLRPVVYMLSAVR